MTEYFTKIDNLLETVKRPGMEELRTYMRLNGFYEAPCSGANHLCKKGGLAEHSWNVYETMCKATESMYGEITEDIQEHIIICSILHDLGKIGDYGKPNYVPNMIKDGKPTKAEPEQKYKQSEAKPYETNKELTYVPHEVRSVSSAGRFIQLTEDEYYAILMHNGLYGDFKYVVNGKETPLYLLLHFADMWCSRVTEKGK